MASKRGRKMFGAVNFVRDLIAKVEKFDDYLATNQEELAILFVIIIILFSLVIAVSSIIYGNISDILYRRKCRQRVKKGGGYYSYKGVYIPPTPKLPRSSSGAPTSHVAPTHAKVRVVYRRGGRKKQK